MLETSSAIPGERHKLVAQSNTNLYFSFQSSCQRLVTLCCNFLLFLLSVVFIGVNPK